MSEMGEPISYSGARKADAAHASIRQGHRRVGAIAAASALAPTTVLWVASLLRDHRKLDRPPATNPLELLPVFQRSNPESSSVKIGSAFRSDCLIRSMT